MIDGIVVPRSAECDRHAFVAIRHAQSVCIVVCEASGIDFVDHYFPAADGLSDGSRMSEGIHIYLFSSLLTGYVLGPICQNATYLFVFIATDGAEGRS